MEDRRPGRTLPDQRTDEEYVGFVGRAAHDLQGPLAVIEGWAVELAGEEGEPTLPAAEVQRMVDQIRIAATAARSLVDALLADAVARDRESTIERVDLTALARELAGSRPGAVDVCVREVGVVPGDRVLLRRLLANLLDNAVKYVPRGATPHVTVSGTVVGEELRISVADLGIGIPRGQHERIFGDFERAASDHPGTGLGLSICRRIAERHGGRISARDRDDNRQGAVFEVVLPAWNQSRPQSRAVRPDATKGENHDH